MPFNATRIAVSSSNAHYQNLQYGSDPSQTVTFKVTDLQSHFGVKKSKFGGYDIGVSVTGSPILKKLLAVEARCAELMTTPNYPSGERRLMKRLSQNGNYDTLYLNLEPEDVKRIAKEKPCAFSGLITVSAIYLGDAAKKHTPNLRVEVSEVKLKLTEPIEKTKPKRVAIVESDSEADDE